MKTRHTIFGVLLLLFLGNSSLYAQNNAAFSWGVNQYGQLGDGTTTDRHSPIQVGTTADWTFVSAGAYHVCAIQSDGSLWAWGRNENGQIGDGTRTQRLSPVQIGTGTSWVSVTCGGNRSHAIQSDGTLWAWGGGGQLGDITAAPQLAPVQIGTAANWVYVFNGLRYTHAIKSDGTLWACGQNNRGQLGDGTTTDRSVLVQIGSATNWSFVTGGGYHTLAVRSDGTLWAWGDNGNGQLGDGTTTRRLSPVQIGTATNWVSVSAGAGYSLATKSDGTLWGWGSNWSGQLGDGTTTDRHTPVQIGTAASWTFLECGYYHAMGLRSDSTLWAWGSNAGGQLGDGTTMDRHSPSRVGTSERWTTFSAGSRNTVALMDTVIVHAGPDHFITLGYGSQSVTLTATASGGTAPYSFLWSTSETTSSITVSPTAPTTYTVTVTDAASETWTDTVFVDVLDVRCGANLDLILYCQDGVTKCDTERKATLAITKKGATLGACTGNQPPVAVANATPTSGKVVLMVSFSSSGSYDPDGTITDYFWEFGDSGVSTLANPSHNYLREGTYIAVLTVTDNDGATATDDLTITVGPPVSSSYLHIASQNVTRVTLPGGKIGARDVIIVKDYVNRNLSGAVVTATYTGPTSGTVSGTTGSNGAVTLSSAWDRNPSGTWCFTVTDVQLSGYTLDASSSVMSACEPAPKASVVSAGFAAPTAFSLSQNYPNPFNSSTSIEFGIPEDGAVRLVVYDLYGREVRTLVNEVKDAGAYQAHFEGADLPSGVYIYQFVWNGRIKARTMTLLK